MKYNTNKNSFYLLLSFIDPSRASEKLIKITSRSIRTSPFIRKFTTIANSGRMSKVVEAARG